MSHISYQANKHLGLVNLDTLHRDTIVNEKFSVGPSKYTKVPQHVLKFWKTLKHTE
jgi:hypothetical protein